MTLTTDTGVQTRYMTASGGYLSSHEAIVVHIGGTVHPVRNWFGPRSGNSGIAGRVALVKNSVNSW